MRGKNHQRRVSRRELGQAQVESALTLPLALFMILGAIQLFMIQNARVMAEYAAFRAARAGSVNHASCTAMLHSALAAVLPTLRPVTTAEELGDGFEAIKENRFGENYTLSSGMDISNEEVLWIERESPTEADLPLGRDEDDDFDFIGETDSPLQLQLTLVYWYPMRIPFADWVLFRIAMANMGIQEYLNANPMMMTHKVDWETTGGPDAYLNRISDVTGRMFANAGPGRYLFPIQTSSTMRMMTPVKRHHVTDPRCR